MKVLLLGTGAADGIPNPFCQCRTCRSAVANRNIRHRTSALVDNVILLDPGPDAAGAAARAGVSLSGVRHMLITHNHHDHVDPSLLLSHTWAKGGALSVHGPQRALEALRDWLPPDSPVTLVPIAAGAAVRLETPVGTYLVRAVAAEHSDLVWEPGRNDGSALVYDITGPGGTKPGGRLLYLTDTGPLPSAAIEQFAAHGDVDLILLEETFGHVTDHGTGHLDFRTFPLEIAKLRRAGITGRIIPIHIGHHNPPEPELSRQMAEWSVGVVPDLAELDTADAPGPGTTPGQAPIRTLVTGGVRSGKSHWAEQSVAAAPAVRYIATAAPRPDDAEWAARVALHRSRRPAHWVTLEGVDLATALSDPAWHHDGAATLVDCLALWLTGVLDGAGVWEGASGSDAVVQAAIDRLVDAVGRFPQTLVLVTNEVGSGVVAPTRAGRLFADLLGTVNRRVAAVCERTMLVTAGIPLRLNG